MSWQDWILVALLAIAGGMALAHMVVGRKPEEEKLRQQLALAEGIVGILALAWGLWRLIAFITSSAGFFIVIYIVAVLLTIALGLLLGYKLIRKPVGVAGVGETTDRVQAKLSKNQIALGIGGLAAAVVLLLIVVSGPSVPTAPMPSPTPMPLPTPMPGVVPAPAPTPGG
ncbi:MAG TPA: hypothetical protein VJL84_02105 [Kiloniellales bacterium]|nr:hypothetical protein [Kiloniellales bacterium]